MGGYLLRRPEALLHLVASYSGKPVNIGSHFSWRFKQYSAQKFLVFTLFSALQGKNSLIFSHVVAAPVAIGVDRYFVGSVLMSPKSGRRFYTHDLIVERESRDAPFKTGALGNEGLPGGTHPGSIKSILYRIAGVNTRGESSEEPGSRKRRDEEGA